MSSTMSLFFFRGGGGAGASDLGKEFPPSFIKLNNVKR